MYRAVEILLYKLQPDSSNIFHRVMQDISIPLHQKAGIDVVAYGKGIELEDSYYLIRSYANLAELERKQAQFYRSEAWQTGPRNVIVSRIISSHRTVVYLEPKAIQALRRLNPGI